MHMEGSHHLKQLIKTERRIRWWATAQRKQINDDKLTEDKIQCFQELVDRANGTEATAEIPSLEQIDEFLGGKTTTVDHGQELGGWLQLQKARHSQVDTVVKSWMFDHLAQT